METGPDVMRRYRKLRGSMSQDKLAKRAGLTTGAISQIERAVDRPRRETAERIDEALDADGEVLVAFGYIATNGQTSIDELATRLAAIEQVAREGVPVLDLLHTEIQGLRQRVVTLEAAVRTLKRRRPQASGE